MSKMTLKNSKGTLHSTYKDYKGTMYNIPIEQETGDLTYEDLAMINKDEIVTCTEYAICNGF